MFYEEQYNRVAARECRQKPSAVTTKTRGKAVFISGIARQYEHGHEKEDSLFI